MAFSSGARINTNISAYNALNALNNVNRDLSVHQLRLSTGKKINSAADDASGYVISKKMEARVNSMQAAVDNIGDAQSMLGVAEGAYQTVADLLTSIKQDVTKANDGSYTDEEKQALVDEVGSMMDEIDNIGTQTQFNGTALLGGSYSKSFQVGATSSEMMTISMTATSSASSLLSVSSSTLTTTNLSSLNVDSALSKIDTQIGKIGAMENRLSVKESNLNTAITNTQAAQSRIADADVASEEIKSVKDQILQQTATAQLAQANKSPQVFLTLFQ
jgi:flagellin